MAWQSSPVCIARADFGLLLGALRQRGYRPVGPTVRDGAIIYDELHSEQDLPIGWTDVQEAGSYRLARREDAALFGYNVGPHSWKQFLFPPRQRLWQAHRSEDGFTVEAEPEAVESYAFIGVRACELKAIQVQDRVFAGGQHTDTAYSTRREKAFIVAVNCGQAAATCFCTSTQTGPEVAAGFDLALTEIIAGDTHYFVAEAGSEEGQAVLDALPHRPAEPKDLRAANTQVENATSQMGRAVDLSEIKELLYRNYDNKRWDALEKRCLACGNCTMVCPTCFCSTVEDTTDLTGDHAERWRRWDSCFTGDFSYIHGGSIRPSTRSRYRQWLVHKLATWLDQFGTSGCVGCGRCITWCPVGIDLTQEVKAIRSSDDM